MDTRRLDARADDEAGRLRAELARVRRELEEAERRYRTLVESAPDAILIADFESAFFVEANPAACDLFGYDVQEFRRLKGRLLHPETEWPTVDAVSRDIVESGRAWHPSIRMRTKGGRTFWGEIRIRAYEIGGKKLYVTIIRDVTARVERESTLEASQRTLEEAQAQMVQAGNHLASEAERLRRQLVHSDRLVAIGQVAAGVVHEINNPAMLVLGSAELLDAALERLRRHARAILEHANASNDPALAELHAQHLPERELDAASEALANVRDGIQRVSSIARDLRVFSRIEGRETEDVALDDVARAALALAGPQVRHSAELVSTLERVPTIQGNRARLAQVLVNLLINAAQAVEDAPAGEHRVTIATGVEAGHVVCRVTDTGRGVPAELVERVFDPFFTTKAPERGTGLGLSIARDIARAHGGDVTVEEHARGSCFALRIPLAPART